MNEKHIGIDALDLEGCDVTIHRREINIRRSYSCIEMEVVYNDEDSWYKCHKTSCKRQPFSVDDIHCICCKIDSPMTDEEECPHIEGRGYYLSTEDLLENKRFKLNRSKSAVVDIETIIENSWLKTDISERRASVFTNIAPPLETDYSTFQETFNRSSIQSQSSCSSSNDTSDENSVDVIEERRKLDQQLEGFTLRMESRSPLPQSSSFSDDMKATTPTINEQEQNMARPHSIESSDGDVFKKVSSTNSLLSIKSISEKLSFDIHGEAMRKSSLRRQSVHVRSDSSPPIDTSPSHLTSIPIVHISDNDSTETYQNNSYENNKGIEIVSNLLVMPKASVNRSRQSSRTSSNECLNPKDIPRSKQDHRKIRRPYTITGISLPNPKIVQDGSSSNYDQNSNFGEDNDIQESIDSLKAINSSLFNISPEDLEKKCNGMNFIYQTDRSTVIDRAKDANQKCNKALTNVEQEFQVLKHLINNLAQVVNAPSELIIHVKASVSVLEKCVEYLSAKSETLGSIEQELRMSSVIDVMSEYISMLSKQKEKHACDFEELRLWKESNAKSTANGSFDQSRSKRGTSFIKDPKTRFQTAARNAAMKSKVVRQFAAVPMRKNQELFINLDTEDSFEDDPAKTQSSLSSAKCRSITDSHYSLQHVITEGIIPKSATLKTLPSYEEITDMQKRLNLKQRRLPLSTDHFSDLIEGYETQGEDRFDRRQNISTRIIVFRRIFYALFTSIMESTERLLLIIIGFGITLASLLPWFLTSRRNEDSSFSIPIVKNSHLSQDRGPISTEPSTLRQSLNPVINASSEGSDAT